jgi:hypothetical protein
LEQALTWKRTYAHFTACADEGKWEKKSKGKKMKVEKFKIKK